MGLDQRYHSPMWTPLFLHRTLLREYIQEKAFLFVNQITKTASGTVPNMLDVGCGHMPFRDLFIATDKVNYIGADIPWAGVQPDITIVPETGVVDAKSETFDGVVHFQTLEHVPDPTTFLSETFRVLKPGGHLLCTVPFFYHYHPVPNDYRRWTVEGLKYDLEKSGFQDVQMDCVESDIVSMVTVLNLYIADMLLGYRFTKPLFLIANGLAWIFRKSGKGYLPLTVSATARKAV